jgi:hypothetical protein
MTTLTNSTRKPILSSTELRRRPAGASCPADKLRDTGTGPHADQEWSHRGSKAAVTAGIAENGFALYYERASSKPIIESDRVEGTAVFDVNGRHIGEIRRLLIEKVSGQVCSTPI